MTEPHAVRLNDLVRAIRQGQYAVRKMGTPADAYVTAVDNFAHEVIAALTARPEQEPEPDPEPCDHRYGFDGDGPDALYRCSKCGALAPGEPDPARRTVICSCDRVDTVAGRQVWGLRDPFCTVHGYRDRTVAEIGLCGWRHPVWPGLYCTVRADQYHREHASHDRYGDVSWNPTLAVQGQQARPASKDWPAWTGTAS